MTVLALTLGSVADVRDSRSPASVPVEVLDSDGTILERAGVSSSMPRNIEVPAGTAGPIFVRAVLPSGERQTQRIELTGQDRIPVTLFQEYVSPNEWLAWSRPHLRLKNLQRDSTVLQAFGNVWTRLWRRKGMKWEKVAKIVPQRIEQAPYACQFELALEAACYLLQIGGDALPWRFVSLPGNGTVRILITHNMSSDARADPLRVAVSRMKPDEETLLAYLNHDRLIEAQSLSKIPSTAERLLSGKYDDPISACIGAYFLLRTNRLQARIDWAENLYRDFAWLPDGAIVFASQLLREGGPLVGRADAIVDEALRRGIPVYQEGLTLLNDAAQLLAIQANRTHDADARCRRIEDLVVAAAWSGPMCGFYGRHPDKPLADHFVGLPKSRKRLNQYAGLSFKKADRAQERRLVESASSKAKRLPRKSSPKSSAPAGAIEPADLQDDSLFFVVRA